MPGHRTFFRGPTDTDNFPGEPPGAYRPVPGALRGGPRERPAPRRTPSPTPRHPPRPPPPATGPGTEGKSEPWCARTHALTWRNGRPAVGEVQQMSLPMALRMLRAPPGRRAREPRPARRPAARHGARHRGERPHRGKLVVSARTGGEPDAAHALHGRRAPTTSLGDLPAVPRSRSTRNASSAASSSRWPSIAVSRTRVDVSTAVSRGSGPT